MAKIETIEGIGPAHGAKLREAGVNTVEGLLEKGATPKGRKELAEATGIPAAKVLKFVNMADLCRIKGIGEEYSELLEAAGVDTVKELAQRNAENLHAKMTEVNEAKKLVRALPGASQVADWVTQAKGLPRVVSY